MYNRNDRTQILDSHRFSRMRRERRKKGLPTHIKESRKKKKKENNSLSAITNLIQCIRISIEEVAVRSRCSCAKYESRIIALVSEFREIARSIRGWSFLISCPGCAWTPQRRSRGQGTRLRAADRKETYDGWR